MKEELIREHPLAKLFAAMEENARLLGRNHRTGPGLKRSTLRRDEGRSKYKPHIGAKQRGQRHEVA